MHIVQQITTEAQEHWLYFSEMNNIPSLVYLNLLSHRLYWYSVVICTNDILFLFSVII